jgi:hypothetical protein
MGHSADAPHAATADDRCHCNARSKGAEMAIVVVFRFPDGDRSSYERVFELGGSQILDQPKRLSHVSYEDAGGFTVIDVWEQEADFAAFGAVIGGVLAQIGLDAAPEIHQAFGTISQDGTRRSF